MNCQDVLELITAEIDGELTENQTKDVRQHLSVCGGCQTSFELERTTRSLVRSRIQRIAAPPALKKEILRKLSREAEDGRPRGMFVRNLFKSYFWRITLALGATAAVILSIVVLRPPGKRYAHGSPPDNNIIHQTYNNFDGVLDGKLKPAVTSEDPRVIRAYFVNAANFGVQVPPMPRCKLIGAVFDRYTHEGTAHLVYRYNDDVISMFETGLQNLLDNDGLQIPDDILGELLKSGSYFENHIPDRSFVMWLQDSTVCCAIADVSKNQLLTFFNERE